MSDCELEIDYKWKCGKLQVKKKEVIFENTSLRLEKKTLEEVVSNQFARLSKVFINWFARANLLHSSIFVLNGFSSGFSQTRPL
jgi:regulator of replication initiation timing